MPPRFIFVIGGVISGLGKGITTASIGKLLQYQGYSVTAIKIDPYLNQDAGTMRPTEHGEVWVTEDGGEIDQADLGVGLGKKCPGNERCLWPCRSLHSSTGEGLIFTRLE